MKRRVICSILEELAGANLDPHYFCKLDPDPRKSEKLDADPDYIQNPEL
jgi:hypothetical protein